MENKDTEEEKNLPTVKKEEKKKKTFKEKMEDLRLSNTFTRQEQRHIELLKKYYPVDEKKRLITVRLYYGKAGDLFRENIGREESPLLKNDIFEELQNIINDIPVGYKMLVHLRIGDYEDYTPKEIANNLSDTMELNHFKGERNRRKKWVSSALLIIIGILILFLMGYGNANSWFGEGERANLISEVLDIAAWVFIWEAVTIVLVEPSENLVSRLGYIGRIQSFSFYQGNEKKPLYVENFQEDDYKTRFENSTRAKKFISALFLIAGSLEVILGMNSIFMSSIHFFQQTDGSISSTAYIFSLFASLFQILAGISATECYLNQGRLRNFTHIFAIVSLVLVISLLIHGIFFSHSRDFWVSNWFNLVINVIYIAGYLIYRSNQAEKKPKK